MRYPPKYPAWDAKNPKVPVDRNGHWSHYPSVDCEWESVVPFFAVLRIDSMRSGRSAKYLIVEDSTGRRYPMFVSDLINFIKTGNVTNGELIGHWTASKRGQNYGIKAAPPTSFKD